MTITMARNWKSSFLFLCLCVGVPACGRGSSETSVEEVQSLFPFISKKHRTRHHPQKRETQKATSSDELVLVDLGDVLTFAGLDLRPPLRFEFYLRALEPEAGPETVTVTMTLVAPDGTTEELSRRVDLLGQPKGDWIPVRIPYEGTKEIGAIRMVVLAADQSGKDSPIVVLSPRVRFSRMVTASPSPDRRRVVLLTLDTLRADHLGCYGNRNIKTPNFDAFAEDSVLFEQAFSTANNTNPAHTSLFTSLYLKDHQVDDNFKNLTVATPTMVEGFYEAGCRTAAVVSSFVFAPNRSTLGGRFDEFFPCRDFFMRRAEETNAAVIPWINENFDRDFFLWVHYFDPHYPYNPPYPFDRMYGNIPEGTRRQDEAWTQPESWHNLYQGEVSYLDQQVGVLLDHLKALGIYDSTVIIMVADHGECIQDFGIEHDHKSLFDVVTHVPLLMKFSGNEYRGRVNGLTTVIDVYPTLFDYLGLPITHKVRGESRLSLIRQLTDKNRTVKSPLPWVYGEHSKGVEVAIRTADMRFLLGIRNKVFSPSYRSISGKATFYDVSDVGLEREIPVDEGIEAEFREKMAAFLEDRMALPVESLISPRDIRAIEELGYKKE